MNQFHNQLYKPSASMQSTQPTPLATPAGRPNHPRAPVHQIHVNPLYTLVDPFKARTRPYLYSSHLFPTYTPPSNLSSSASTPSNTTTTPSPILSAQISSTRHSSLQPPPTRPPSTQSTSTPHHDDRSIPSKRPRNYTPGPSISSPTHLSLPSPKPLPIEPSLERPAKRRRQGTGRSGTTNQRGSQSPAFPRSLPPSQSLNTVVAPPKPKPKKAPLHPLAVDYGRPMTPAVPRPPFCISSLRGGRIPLSPYPENPDPELSLDDELRGPIDPAIAAELGELMWKQQKRVWLDEGGYADYYLAEPVPKLSPSAHDRVDPTQPQPETAALYGPPPRNNESVHLGESLTSLDVTVIDGDDDSGFEGVLDLYRGAVQGSVLSGELELEIGGDFGLTNVCWGDVSSLEVSIKGKSPTPSPSGELQDSRISTLGEYRQVVEAENARALLKQVAPKEKPPLGIEWTYKCCGYVVGKVVDTHKANRKARG